MMRESIVEKKKERKKIIKAWRKSKRRKNVLRKIKNLRERKKLHNVN